MKVRKLSRRVIWGIALGVLCSGAAEAIECYTPLEGQPKLGSRWNRDVNNNNVDDNIEITSDARIDVLLDLNDCAAPEDLARFAQFGKLGYIAKSISVVQLLDVARSNAVVLGSDPRVAMVEWDHPFELLLDVTKPRPAGPRKPHLLA